MTRANVDLTNEERLTFSSYYLGNTLHLCCAMSTDSPTFSIITMRRGKVRKLTDINPVAVRNLIKFLHERMETRPCWKDMR
jgi:hypothetical protein